MLPLALSLGATVCFGVLYFFTAKLSRRIGPLTTLFLFQAAGIPMLLLLYPFFSQQIGSTGIATLAILGIFDALVWLLFLHASKVGFLPMVTVLGETYILVTTALGVLLFQETFTFIKVISIGSVLMGMTLLSVDIGSFVRTKKAVLLRGFWPAIISACGVGLYFIFVTPSARAYGWLNTAFYIRVAIAAGAFSFIALKKSRIQYSEIPWKLVLGAALCDVVGFSLLNIALTLHEVSYVSIVVSTSSTITVLLSYFFLKEKINGIQFIGIVFALLGIIVLQLK